ncbi:MAG: hypothetical protein LUQ36_07205 [Methanoregula sp.]|nr:hypothetical protein [Methanoregula sp.]
MNLIGRTQSGILLRICCVVVVICVSAYEEMTAYLRDTIPLSGLPAGLQFRRISLVNLPYPSGIWCCP